MGKQLFGTDGIRGVAGEYPLDRRTVHAFGIALAGTARHLHPDPEIVIGMDTRESGPWIAEQVAGGLAEGGVRSRLAGVVTTPGIAYLTRADEFVAGVMISASHNPYQDNGIKFFSNDGLKLADEIEARIEELIVSNEIAHLRPTADAIGKAFRIDDAEGRYIEFVKRSLPRDLDFQGIKLVVDCANGAAYKVAPTVLRELGAKVDVIGNKPDGMNINAGCGAVHPALLQRAVKEFDAHLGIALDGDADRAIFVCEQGDVINGDHIMAALGLDLHRHGLLAKQTVVGTVMSNFGLELALNRAGITLVRTAVGDRYLLERMLAEGRWYGSRQELGRRLPVAPLDLLGHRRQLPAVGAGAADVHADHQPARRGRGELHVVRRAVAAVGHLHHPRFSIRGRGARLLLLGNLRLVGLLAACSLGFEFAHTLLGGRNARFSLACRALACSALLAIPRGGVTLKLSAQSGDARLSRSEVSSPDRSHQRNPP